MQTHEEKTGRASVRGRQIRQDWATMIHTDALPHSHVSTHNTHTPHALDPRFSHSLVIARGWPQSEAPPVPHMRHRFSSLDCIMSFATETNASFQWCTAWSSPGARRGAAHPSRTHLCRASSVSSLSRASTSSSSDLARRERARPSSTPAPAHASWSPCRRRGPRRHRRPGAGQWDPAKGELGVSPARAP